MNIGITGASGFIATRVIDIALRRGHDIIAFTRTPKHAIPGCEMRGFAVDTPPDLRGCDAVVHLAGESVVGLWTASKRQRIQDTRVLGTRSVVAAIAALSTPPEVFVCGSAIGFYGPAGDTEITEAASAGSGFLADTVRAWEDEASTATRTRTVLLRTGLVLGKNGGPLRAMKPIFRSASASSTAASRYRMGSIVSHIH